MDDETPRYLAGETMQAMPSAWAGVEADPESAHGLQPGAGVGTSLPTPRAVRDVLIGKDLASGERLPWTLQQLWTHSQVDVMSIIQSNSQLNTFEDSAVENQQFHAIPKVSCIIEHREGWTTSVTPARKRERERERESAEEASAGLATEEHLKFLKHPRFVG